MIGNSIAADIIGAKSVRINAVLVRSTITDYVEYYAKDLKGLEDIIT